MHQQALLTVPAQIRGGVRKLTRQLEHIVDEDVDSVVIAPIDERADRSLIFIGKTGDLPGPLLTCYLNREICHVNYVLINRNNRLILFLLCSLKLRGSAIRREFRQSATEAL